MNSKQRFRARFLLLVVLAAAGVLSVRLYQTDVIRGGLYSAKASAQYSKPAASLFSRGTIFFTGKDGTETAAATVRNGFLIYMNPLQVTDAAGDFDALSQFLPLNKSDFMVRAVKPHDVYEVLADQVGSTTAATIGGLGLAGIHVVPESWRSYPGGTLAAHELGVVGEDESSSEISGRYGLEKYYDAVLSGAGTGGGGDVFAELFSGVKDSVLGLSGGQSGDIVTTIDPTVEAYLEQVLSDTENQWHPDEIGGIVIDPQNGEIEAMASHPTFNPNDLSTLGSSAVLTNPLVEKVYEMGSIMKPLTMTAALDSGTVTPNTTYDDTGCLKIAGYNVCNYDLKARGVIPMQQILSQSLNVGAATIAMMMGSTTMYRYFQSFGLTGKSGMDLPDEAAPIFNNLKHGADIDIATAAFGQGIAVSPVEMARGLSVIANGGYLVTPHIVKEIDYDDGTKDVIDPPKIGPLIKPETATEIQTMLVTVVDKAFASGTIALAHYTQGAKTGTAQIPDPVHGGYYPDRYLHSFFGFFPAYNARFLVFFYQVYPKGAQFASQTLTHAYDEMAGFLINYYDIPPDR